MYILFYSVLRNHVSFLSTAPQVIKLPIYKIKNTVRVSSRMKLAKNSVFLYNFSKFTGILLFVLEYINISLLLKMINGFSWWAKIMASPFNEWSKQYFCTTKRCFYGFVFCFCLFVCFFGFVLFVLCFVFVFVLFCFIDIYTWGGK